MKTQNADHELIGRYITFKGKRCLVTGIHRKNKSNRGIFYRLWNVKKNEEIWTKGNITFEDLIKEDLGAVVA